MCAKSCTALIVIYIVSLEMRNFLLIIFNRDVLMIILPI